MRSLIKVKKEDISKIVLTVEDIEKAKMIASEFLENFRSVENGKVIIGYTGIYKEKEVTIINCNIGMSSMGIYSYELYKFYDVDTIINLGRATAYTRDLNLYDFILVNATYSDSSYAKVQNGSEDEIINSSSYLNFYIGQAASDLNIPITIANIYTTDVLYKENNNYKEIYNTYGCLACDMASFALFHNAKVLNKKASTILTILDSLVIDAELEEDKEEKAIKNATKIALESIL